MGEVKASAARHVLGLPGQFASLQPVQMPPVEQKMEYALPELLRPNDAAFVETAYAALFRRSPDADGINLLSELRAGRVSKVEVLRHMRFSAEGRSKGVL